MSSHLGNHGSIRTDVFRGTRLESFHEAVAVAYHASGKVLQYGPIDEGTHLRSVGKPFQALAMLRAGILESFSITPRELAVICASHAGQPVHRELVRGLLQRGGLSEKDLQCGIHPPFSRSARQMCIANKELLDSTCNNCSGKHSGMLLSTISQQQSKESYLDADHPLQRNIRAIFELFTSEKIEEGSASVDGCGAPTYHMKLISIARAFQRLHQTEFLDRSGLTDRVNQIHDAIASHPKAFSGEGRWPLLWRPYLAGNFLAKEGAEGVMVIWGKKGSLVLKCLDGSDRGLIHAVPELLQRLHWIDQNTYERWVGENNPVVTNVSGRIVGQIQVDIPEPLELDDPNTSVSGMGLVR